MFVEILDQRLIYFNPGRVLSNHVLMSFFAKMDPMPEVRQGRFNILSDHSQIERVELTSEKYRDWALNRQQALHSHQPYKVAIFSSTKLGFGMGRMFESVFNDNKGPVSFMVFSDLDQTLHWLKAADLKQRIISLGKRAAISLKAVR